MSKAVQRLSNLRIRPVEPGDFASIQSLAAKFPTFTIPSEYILWFFAHFHPEYCRIIEAPDGVLMSYLLAMPTSNPPNCIAIWQVAAAPSNQGLALEYFAGYLRELVERTKATSIFFTTTQDSALLRLIGSLANHFFECAVSQLNPIPTGQCEYEFQLCTDSLHPQS